MGHAYKIPLGIVLALALGASARADEARVETTIATENGAAKVLSQTFPFAADGSIEVSNVRGSVTITGGDGGTVKLGGSLGAGSKLALEGDRRHMELRVEAQKGGGWFGNRGPTSDTTLVLDVPRGASIKLDLVSANGTLEGVAGRTIEVGSVSGTVRVLASARSVDIDSVSGDVILQAERVGAIERAHLQTVSGNIKADGVDARVTLGTVSGKIVFSAPKVDELGLESVSGSLEASVAPAKGARIHAESMSGDVRLKLPATLAARIHAETFSGSLKSDYGKVVKEEFGPGSSLDVDGGDDGTRVSAQAFSGSVELRKQ
ncbi:MAG: DUF4097 family beta strand repeat protein [Proteobacteria bacterium]|nr:DUF4097 family beta strand repeat protein [Pseudomonadota bacterium]